MNYQIECCDCMDLLPSQFSGASLVYMDPPYGPEDEDKYYGVGKNLEEYIEYILKRVCVAQMGLTNFNFVMHVDQKCGHYIKVGLDKILGRNNFRNEIIWCYSGPSVAKSHFPSKHDCLYWYGIGKYPFNIQRIPYVGLGSAKGSSWGGMTPEIVKAKLERGKAIEDWWIDIPSLQRNEKEKRGFATQKPKKLLDRIILALSNPGDLVFDPMVGSGSTAISAISNGRRFFGCDKNQTAVDMALLAVKKL
jgi:DNA methylase